MSSSAVLVLLRMIALLALALRLWVRHRGHSRSDYVGRVVRIELWRGLGESLGTLGISWAGLARLGCVWG